MSDIDINKVLNDKTVSVDKISDEIALLTKDLKKHIAFYNKSSSEEKKAKWLSEILADHDCLVALANDLHNALTGYYMTTIRKEYMNKLE